MDSEQPDLIRPPASESERAEWRKGLAAWKAEERGRLGYDGSAYAKPAYGWVPNCFSCNMLMVWDEKFLDHRTGEYHVEDYLEEGRRAFGGYDAVVLWHAYPRIGFDDRNQFDYYRDLPGGLPGLQGVVQRFHKHNVRVFIDYNPWDTGTRREAQDDPEALAGVVHEIDADGIFLDTLSEGSIALRNSIDRVREGVGFESESSLPVKGISLNHLSWAQWYETEPQMPGVLRNRWFEQRHMMHLIRRWDTDHTDELHTAWMNGAGMLVWENIFGSWNPWRQENRKLLRSMVAVQRHFSRHFSHGMWVPLISTACEGVFASEWILDGTSLFTVVNRTPNPMSGWTLGEGDHRGLVDLFTGERIREPGYEIPPSGVAAVLAVGERGIDESLQEFLSRQAGGEDRDRTSRALHPLSLTAVHSKPRSSAALGDAIPVATGTYKLVTRYRSRECGERGYAPYWNDGGPNLHQPVDETRSVKVGAFKLAAREVTDGEFHEFLKATGYAPRVKDHFLRHWEDGRPPGTGEAPVVFVNLEDARAFAAWRGSRLPTEVEWQLAMEKGQPTRGPRPVWNWTDSEYSDGRTRYCILKGGSWYEPKGSVWYSDAGVQRPDFSAKFIEVWAGLDRCETIGFRCAI